MTIDAWLWIALIVIMPLTLWLGHQADAVSKELRKRNRRRSRKLRQAAQCERTKRS